MKRIAIVMMAALGLAIAGTSQASEELAKKSGCLTCHNVKGAKKMGPALDSFAGKSEAEFVQIMADLKLPYPKQIDRALPANQQCGRVSGAQG